MPGEDVYYEEDQDQEEDFNEASYQAFDEEPTPGYPKDSEGDGVEYEDYELSESEAIALNCLEELEDPQKLDMLYSYNWQHMQPLARLKARAKVCPRKVKERARLFVVT